jgi:hypothetical protein
MNYLSNNWFQHQWCEVAAHLDESEPEHCCTFNFFKSELPEKWEFDASGQATPSGKLEGKWQPVQFAGECVISSMCINCIGLLSFFFLILPCLVKR